MTDPPQSHPAATPAADGATLSPLKRAFLALEEAQARLAAAEGAANEPIAVIGIGCRVPGADGPAAFWRLLREGRDAVGPIPRDRFDIDAYFDADTEAAGGIAVREAGFIDAVDHFDPAFFGISPREARGMDPQQRLLLEVAWEALEHAGQAPDRLSTSATGVYVGQCSFDYAVLMHRSGDPSLLDSHFTSGVAHSVTSGRVSYLLGLQGPSLTVDTACSSSLVAVHLACQALRTRECRMALAGGVNLMLSEDLFIAFSHSRMLARDGRCKTFDAAADGFGRGEGCGMVVLKRLADAQADGDRILAVIRGSAVNQDGPSSGLTAPNGPAQEAVIRAALAQAGVTPADIGCIEAHGTGTQLGDPLEVQALGHVFDGRDASTPLWLGSVKTNVGHLEAAAGVSGLIKLVLALQHREIPPHLHLREPSPHIPWSELPVRVPTALQPWPAIGGRRLGGVSSFGFSGTNVHLVVEEAPPAPIVPQPPAPQLFVLSARDPVALLQLARRHADTLAAMPDTPLADICRTASAGRAQFAHRAAIIVNDSSELRARLAELATDLAAPAWRTTPPRRRDPPRVAFVFTGQGAQHAGMAQALYETEPTFRAALDRCVRALDGHLDRPLLGVLFGDDGVGLLDRTEYTQPALFAVEVALAELWRGWGVTPTLVMGHSVGEIAAACIAGVMSLDDAAALICARGRLMGALPPGGAMAAVAAAAVEVTPHLATRALVGIAAINSPTQTVISGAAADIDAVCAALSARGVTNQRLQVSHAFHSPLVEPMLDAFEAVVRGLRLSPPRLRLVSNLGGTMATAVEITQPLYWRRHVRETVRFADAAATLASQRIDVCLEIGPHPALLQFIAQAVPDMPLFASLRRGRPDREQILQTLAGLWLDGAEIDWCAVWAGHSARPVALPTYPFQRERCWFSVNPASARPATVAKPGAHPLLGARMRAATEQRIHGSRIEAGSPAWVAEHRVHGRVVVPATAYLEMLLAAAADVHNRDTASIDNVTLQEAMVLPDVGHGARAVQLIVEPPNDGVAAARLCSQHDDDAADAWSCHVTARLLAGDVAATPAATTLAAARASCTQAIDRDAFYSRLARCGLAFGPAFHSVQRVWRGEAEALGEVVLTADLEPERAAYRIHPVQLDGCLQVIAAALGDDSADALFMPLAFGRYRLLQRPSGRCWARAAVRATPNSETRRADVRVYDEQGTVVAELLDVQLKRARAGALARLADTPVDDLVHEIVWREAPLPTIERADSPALATLSAAAETALQRLRNEVGLDAYDACLPRLDALCAEFVAHALAQLGCSAVPGERLEGAALAVHLDIAPRHRQLFARLLDILAEQGWLAREGDAWRVQRPFADAHPGRQLAAFAATQPPIAAELELTGRTGVDLAPALRGHIDPLQLLFPAGSTATAERVYRDAAPARLFNGVVAAAVAAAAEGRSAARPLRILEIGAGTGGTTAHVLQGLPDGAAVYTFTDVGASFVARARERFGALHPFMRFQVLDLEDDPSAHGLPAQSYDVILASNVVHATRDVRRSLTHVRQLLAPGGVLLLLEACAPQAWFDLTVGLTEGWWRFSDHHLRPDYPTLARAAWTALLGDVGFGPVTGLAGDAAQPGALGLNTLLLAQAPAAAVTAPRRWLLWPDAGGVVNALATRLRAHGDHCELVRNGQPVAPLLQHWHAQGHRWHGVIHAGMLDARDAAALPPPALHSALQFAQGLVALGAPTRLWLLTRGAQATVAPDEVTDAAAAALWGFARTLRLEHPELGVVCIDLDDAAADAAADALWAELQAQSAEPERVLRGGTRRVPRLVRTMGRTLPQTAPALSSWRLAPERPGSLERLIRVSQNRRAPGPGEVEIAVEATGLNFKDVLNVLGLYPGDPGPLGGECSGRIIAVGAGVDHVAIGDAVLALAAGSFASHVVTRAEFVQPLPAGMTAEDGAAFAIAHLTALFCLEHLAALRAGQTVLIHAAAGGVGLAAVRLALRRGATVYATAGAPWKRDLLRELGVAEAFDSRSAAFSPLVLGATAGRGVDVVLNSLAGDTIEPSFAALADGGCFVEIGKRDIKSAEWVQSLHRGLRYHVVDWGATAQRDPALVGAMLAELVGALRDGTLAPLPRHVFELDDAARAWRFMAQARHAGRIVLRHATAPPWRPSRQGTYLITGGLSGLGLAVAEWLAAQGVGRLVLIGRRGVPAEAAPVVAALRASGIPVWTEALDVTDESGLRALLTRLRAEGPPLRGVWHSAGVLDDATLLQQHDGRLAQVFAPKVIGARLLDRLTRVDALDCFVLFSSAAGVLGSAGQVNHAAANATLDALAHDRAARALPALSIDWGAWGEVGSAADRGIGGRLAAQGLGAISPASGLAAMARLIERRTVQAVVLAIDWAVYRAQVLKTRPGVLLSELSGPSAAPPRAAPSTTPSPVLVNLAGVPAARQRSVLGALIRERALRALGLDAQRVVDPRTPLGELGLDSLLAVELRNTLGNALGRTLPATLLFDHPTLDALTDYLCAQLLTPPPSTAGATNTAECSTAARIIDSIEELSDAEVELKWAARTRSKT